MNEELVAYLQNVQPGRDGLIQAMRSCVVQDSDFLPEEDMLDTMRVHVGAEDLQGALKQLEADGEALEAISLLVLSRRWERPGGVERTKTLLADARGKAPVVELGVVAIVAMYAMYLLVTDGKTSWKRITRRSADGAVEEQEEATFHSFGGLIDALLRQFRRRDSPQGD